jgi:holo-[acyl-carrier protein] synthase
VSDGQKSPPAGEPIGGQFADSVYHGIDIVEVARITRAISRYGDRFLLRVFTPAELERYRERNTSLAARWAAKEAAAKLLGVGVRGLSAGPQSDAIGWHEVETLSDARGRPTITLSGAAAQRAAQLRIRSLAVSLSHTGDLAVASVVGLADRRE